MKRNKQSDGLVFSTDRANRCPGCGRLLIHCVCQEATAVRNDGIVRIFRQTKGRKGSGVCLVNGLPLDGDELKKLAKQLKQKCGSGGSVKDGVIEIQGDHRQLLQTELQKLGYRVKLAGG